MKYTEAFRKLGYKLDNHQTDWSAEGPDGVCISLWRDKVSWSPSPPVFDTDEAWPDGELGIDENGHAKRTRHIARAVDEFGGAIDVVVRQGTYRDRHGDTEPWDAKRRGGRWKITRFDGPTGKFRAEVVVQNKRPTT